MCGAAGLLRKERGNYSSLKLVNIWEYYLMYLKYKFNIYNTFYNIPLPETLHFFPRVRYVFPSRVFFLQNVYSVVFTKCVANKMLFGASGWPL